MQNLADIKCFLLDMDGTFYLGNTVLPGALDFMSKLTSTGREYLFITNNSSRNADYYAAKLSGMGWSASPSDILTSGEATARYLQRMKPKARIYLLGTADLIREFEIYGFILTADNPDFVVLGFDMTLTYEKLVVACNLIRSGVPFVATHPDFNCPTEDGYIPDCGSIIELIHASTGIRPYIVGKPNPEIVAVALSKKIYLPQQVAIVGDRLYTDIATGKNSGIKSILVLTGEATAEDLKQSAITPDYVFDNLGAIGDFLSDQKV